MLPERAAPLLEDAAERSRMSLRMRLRRVRVVWRSTLHAALAAPVAWLIATQLLGHKRPFFAPIAAIIVLGQTVSQRGRRAVEIAIGVSVGILLADVLIKAIGTGAWQLAVVVIITISVARLLGTSSMLVNQAAVAGVLISTVPVPAGASTFQRLVDGLVGGGVALLVNAVVFPAHPVRMVREAAQPLLDELAQTLEDIARTILDRDREQAERALERARAIDSLESALGDAIQSGRETTRYAPSRRRARGWLESYADAAAQIDLAVRNVRVLARGVIRALELGDRVPPDVADAVRDLADAVRNLAPVLDQQAPPARVREPALRAAGRASAVLMRTANLSVSVIVGQIRSTAVDLIVGIGMHSDEAADAVRTAAREADEAASAG